MTITKLLTTAEVAERLRCSEAKVKRLRLAGLLAYLPGRPVLIPETAVEAYIATACAQAAAKVAATAKVREARERRASGAESEAEVRARAQAWFAQQRLREQFRATNKAAKLAKQNKK